MALYLSEDDVRQVLTMPLALEAVEEAFAAHASGSAIDVPRQRTRTPHVQLHILQGALPADNVVGYKAYTSSREGARFLVYLFAADTGRLRAVVAADYLGMMRTGAASGVATRWLARREAAVAGVFGSGWQAEGHVAAIAAVRSLRLVKVFSRRREQLETFCERMSGRLAIAVVAAATPEETVRGSDLVGTVTTAARPLFAGEWLEPGTHINAAGSNAQIRQEIDEASIRRCSLIAVDSVEVALRESGDLFPMVEKGRLHAGQLVPLGQIIAGRQRGRPDEASITLFESQGMAIQDLALARRILELAELRGLGTPLPF